MGESLEELPKQHLVHVRGETINLDALTGAELIETGKRLQYPFLVIKGQEKQVVEGAEQMLKEMDNKEEK